MAVEQDELKLTVTLDDQASEQLGNLHKALNGIVMSVVPAQKGLQQVGQSLRGLGGHAQGLHGSLGGLAARGGFIGGFFFEVGKQVENMVKQFAEAVLDIQAYADSMVKLDQVSSRASTSMGQFRANVAVFKESGVSGEQAGKMLSGYSDALADLQRPNSRILVDVMRGQVGAPRENMLELVRTVMTSDQQTGINAIRAAGQAIRAEHEEQGRPELGAQAQANFYARWGMPGLENVRGEVKSISAEQARLYADRRRDAERYQTSIAQQSDAWDKTIRSVQAIAFETLPIASGSEKVAEFFNYMVEGAHALERALRNTNTEADKERSEEARKKVVTPEGKEITAQEGLSADEKRKQGVQRRFNPRRSETTRPGEALPPPDEATPGGGTYKQTPLSPGGKYGSDIEFDPFANVKARKRVIDPASAGQPYRRVGLLGGEVEAGVGADVPRKPDGQIDMAALDIPNIGDLLPSAGGTPIDMDEFMKGKPSGLSFEERMTRAGVPMSKNIIDLRGQSPDLAYIEEQSERLKLLTDQVNQLNEYLAPELMRMLLAGTGAPDFHNAPQGGAEGESNPMQLPPVASQPGGGAASEAAQAARAEPKSRIATSMSEAMTYLEKNESKHAADLKDYMKTGGRNLTGDSNAWCARFVDAIQTRAGRPSLESSLPEGQKSGQKEDRTWSSLAYKDWGRAVGTDEDIKEGDVFVKQRAGGGHVGTATGNYRVNAAGVKEYEMLSGNIGGAKKGGGEVNTTWETIGGRGGPGETVKGAGHGGVVAVRRGEEAKADAGPEAKAAAYTGPEEGAGKGRRLDAPVAPGVAQQFAGGGDGQQTAAPTGGGDRTNIDTRDVPNIGDLLRPDQNNAIRVPPNQFAAATGWRGLPLSQNIQDERANNYDPGSGLPLALWRNPAQIGPLYNTQTGAQIAEGGSPLEAVYADQPRPEDQPPSVQRSRGELDSAPGSGAALDRAAGGAALDRAAVDTNVDVNQSGSLRVDVNAPAGTSVKAEGDGVFNQTETNRSVPMEQPATAE